MKRFIDLCTYMVFIVFTSLMLTACEKDNDQSTEKGGNTTSTGNVPDPEGTINVSMRNGDRDVATKIDGNFFIDYDNNFSADWGVTCSFACVGKVNGLGNIKGIPTKGWATKVAVEPGNGYVIYYSNNGYVSFNKYYSLYVEDYILNTSSGIIGAKVKYLTPFNGKDVEIKLDLEDSRFTVINDEIYFYMNSNSEYIFFKDFNEIVVFDVKIENSENLSYHRTSSKTEYHPIDGIQLEVRDDKKPVSGTVIITTAYGKETKFHVVDNRPI